jgi:predicted ATPase/DNA-binding CsgD family transcriptional regulator
MVAYRSHRKPRHEHRPSLSLEERNDRDAHNTQVHRLTVEQPLPASLLPIIGRSREITAIGNFLQQPEVRLLTMIGPGGVGKTHLALQIPGEISSFFPDGICFVSLVHINDVNLLFPAIAHSLGLTEWKNDNASILVQETIQNKRFLLILDNFEHVAPAGTQLKELLVSCPQLKILVTSRIVLGLLEEHEFYIHPLELPDLTHRVSCEGLAQVPSIALFLQRVRTVRSDFKLTSANARTIAQICLCLDGLPLAIELAAARMKLFSPQGLLTRLDRRLSFLTSGPRDAPERQQTLRKTVEWSYDLLTQEEQRLFRRLAVFVGGFSLGAIEAISGDMMSDQEEPLLNVVTSLLNQSLLQRVPQASNLEERFTMLETIREYALECLRDSGEEETTHRMHAKYYLNLAQTLEQKIIEGESPHWMACIESEFENLRLTFVWFLNARDAGCALQLSSALWAFWLESAILEGCHWIRQSLECCLQSVTEVQIETKAAAINTIAMLEYYRGDWEQANKYAETSLQLFRSTKNVPGIAKVLVTQGIGAMLQGQYDTAGTLVSESLRLQPKQLSSWLTAEALLVQAHSCYFQGDLTQAYMLGKKSYKLGRQTGELHSMIRAIYACALFANAQKNSAEVQAMHEAIMSITRATNDTANLSPTAVCLIGLGAVAAIQKHYSWAANLWGKAKALYRRRDGLSELEPYKWLTVILGTHLLSSQIVKIVYVQLGEQAFSTAWNEGQAMCLEKLLEQPKIIHSSPPVFTKETVAYSNELTTREREVLGLLAQGMSSASIAEKLVISLVTVNTHIRAIYSKLGVSSRSAATRFAMEHHLA